MAVYVDLEHDLGGDWLMQYAGAINVFDEVINEIGPPNATV